MSGDVRLGARVGRIARQILATAVLALALAGCLRQDTNAGVILRETPRPTTASPIAPGTFRVGQSGSTLTGNIVTVKNYEGPDPSGRPGIVVVAANVEVCTPETAPGRTRVSPRSFELELADRTRRPTAQEGPKEPALAEKVIAPGKCNGGWIHFEIRSEDQPAYVVLLGRSQLRWEV